jgi:thiol-disulfide isomerase/thioredoxin
MLIADRRALKGTLVLLTLLAMPVQAQTDEVGIPLGTIPEAVIIEDLDGNAVDLGQYIGGKPTLFQFWATWCEECKQLEPKMITAHERYGDLVTFIAVSVAVNQSKRSIKKHLEKNPVPHIVLWDTRGRAVRAFAAPTTSYVALLDADGIVVYTGVGRDQDIDMAIRRVVDGTEF